MTKSHTDIASGCQTCRREVRQVLRKCRYTLRTQPYLAATAAFGVGVLLGWVLSDSKGTNR